MTIIYNDNSTLEVNEIEISGNYIYADDLYVVNLDDILKIQSN